MHNTNTPYPCPYYSNMPMYYSENVYNTYKNYPYSYWGNMPNYNPTPWKQSLELKDYGPEPFVINIEEATKQNTNFRTALWTGKYLQLTLMNINVGEDIGLEVHPNLDQFIRIEEGQGLVKMGDKKDKLNFQKKVYDNFAFIIPAGKWHNLVNIGYKPIKLYSIYAPPEHPFGTVHKTKAIAEAEDTHHGY